MTETPSENSAPEFYVPERALVMVAHPDDIEFGMAGTIARWTEAGSHVTYCLITDGAAGSDDPDISRAQLAAIRQDEQRAAAASIGVKDVIFLGHPDGMIVPSLELRRELVRVIRHVKPDTLATMDPTMLFTLENTYINHPDHRYACQTVIDAVFPAAGNRKYFEELLDEGLEPHKVTYVYLMFSEKPTLQVDISAYFERKLDALMLHASQLQDREEIREFIGGWDKESGQAIGVPYAESFRVMKIN
ncbi:MAG: PIG-L family deacetylase [Chloroflexi bacterium]|nr:PIG-L family deacetylase [Chloroflexota bacterium]